MRYEAHIDEVSADGRINGWAADWQTRGPCHIRIVAGERVIAEAVACHFRHDLLEGGLGHGHYAFSAWPSLDIEPGSHAISIVDGITGEPIAPFDRPPLTLPHTPGRPRSTVAALLAPPPRWTDAQLLRRLACLRLDDNLEAMGVDRFVDVTYQYVLGRWADAIGAPLYAGRLDDGSIGTAQFFAELLGAEERDATAAPLPGPYHSRFPYSLSYQRRQRAAA